MVNSEVQDFLLKKEKLERQLYSAWVPHAGQTAILWLFLERWAKGVFLQCGRKFGKTELGIFCLYIFAMLFENAETYYIADEREHAKDICWNNNRLPYFFTTLMRQEGEGKRDFLKRRRQGEKIQNEWLAGDPTKSDMVVRLKNRSTIKVDGAKNYPRADGVRPHFLVYDEFKNQDRRYDKAARPNLDVFDGRIFILGSPPSDEENYYCETRNEFKEEEGHYALWAPSWQNNHVYPQGENTPVLVRKRKLAERTGNIHEYLREHAAVIVPDFETRIFPMISKDRHVKPYEELKAEIKENYHDCEFYVGIDPGTASVFAVIFIVINTKTKDVYLMDEIYKTSQAEAAVSVVWPEVVAKINEWGPPIEEWGLIYDCAALWFANEVYTANPDSKEWGEPNKTNFALCPCFKEAKDKTEMLSVMKGLLREARMLLSDRCENAYIEILKYEKGPTGRIPKGEDHIIDGVRYVLKNAGYSTEEFKEVKVEDKRDTLHQAVESIMGADAARILRQFV